MRKVIPYIASQFRKDRIWLRRTKPAQRNYQIVLAVDDSSSMADNRSKELAFESVALISKALCLLEAGQLGVISFRAHVQLLQPLHEAINDTRGPRIISYIISRNQQGFTVCLLFLPQDPPAVCQAVCQWFEFVTI